MPSQTKPSHENHHVCPWWLAYTFDNPIRGFFHQPQTMLAPYIAEGMTVMDVGCGMGFFSIGMAKMVGDKGKVLSVDIQPKMLEITIKRAKRAGVDNRIYPHHCGPDNIGTNETLDFILTFWMVHEVRDQKAFFSELNGNLASGGRILAAEPKLHVSREKFQKTIETAHSTGLQLSEQPSIRFSHTALFEKY